MKRILYLGLEVPQPQQETAWIHFPVIETTPRSLTEPNLQAAFSAIGLSTHLVMTSKMAARYFVAACDHFSIDFAIISKTPCFSVGKSTTTTLKDLGFKNIITAINECQEGVVDIILNNRSRNMHVFYPHSQLARRDLIQFLTTHAIIHTECILYDTKTSLPANGIPWNDIDAIYFSSPSTVDAFFTISQDTGGKELMYQGAETKKRLYNQLKKLTP